MLGQKVERTQLVDELYRAGLAQVGVKFRQVKECVWEEGTIHVVEFEDSFGTPLAIPVPQFTIFEAVLMVASSHVSRLDGPQEVRS